MGAVSKTKRKAIRTKHIEGTPFERIKNHYLGHLPESYLTKKELELIERWENIWRLYKTHLKTSVAVKLHLSWCESEGYNVSHRSAYNDLQHASKIWGKIGRIDRQAKLLLLDDMATDVYMEAKDIQDLKEMNKAIANLVKINEQVEDYLEDSREPHKYELHLHVNGQQRSLNLNKLPVNNPEYKEVLNQVEEQEADDDTFAKLLDETEQDDTEV